MSTDIMFKELLLKVQDDQSPWTEKMEKYLRNGLTMKRYREDGTKNFLLPWLESMRVVKAEKHSATSATVHYLFPIQREFLNPSGGLHGGAAASFFDVATTWVLFLVSKVPNYWVSMGTTRTLNCVYMRPVQEGEIVRLEADLVHVGKRLCMLRGVLKRDRDGAVIATCEHNKYNVDAERL